MLSLLPLHLCAGETNRKQALGGQTFIGPLQLNEIAAKVKTLCLTRFFEPLPGMCLPDPTGSQLQGGEPFAVIPLKSPDDRCKVRAPNAQPNKLCALNHSDLARICFNVALDCYTKGAFSPTLLNDYCQNPQSRNQCKTAAIAGFNVIKQAAEHFNGRSPSPGHSFRGCQNKEHTFASQIMRWKCP
jgi:hypothetical protein